MKLLSKFIGGILILTISTVTLAYIMSATLLSADYYKAKANELHLYETLSTSIPGNIAGGDPATQAALTSIVSNAYVQQKLNPFLDGIQHYYFDNAPAPQIDFSDFAAEAQRQGIVIPPDSGVTKPIVFQDPGLKQYLSQVAAIKLYGLILALLLAAAMIGINKGRHRFTALGKTLIVAGIWEGVIFLLLQVLPGVAESFIKGQKDIGPLQPILIDLFKSVLADIGHEFGLVAIGLAIAGAALIIAGIIFTGASKLMPSGGGKGKPDQRYARPTPTNRPKVN
jgi:hypothetical protein